MRSGGGGGGRVCSCLVEEDEEGFKSASTARCASRGGGRNRDGGCLESVEDIDEDEDATDDE